jgi:hypothetical protein
LSDLWRKLNTGRREKKKNAVYSGHIVYAYENTNYVMLDNWYLPVPKRK